MPVGGQPNGRTQRQTDRPVEADTLFFRDLQRLTLWLLMVVPETRIRFQDCLFWKRSRKSYTLWDELWDVPVLYSRVEKSKQFLCWISQTLKLGRRGCPETSVRNYRYMLCNNSEEYKSRLHRGGTRNRAKFQMFIPAVSSYSVSYHSTNVPYSLFCNHGMLSYTHYWTQYTRLAREVVSGLKNTLWSTCRKGCGRSSSVRKVSRNCDSVGHSPSSHTNPSTEVNKAIQLCFQVLSLIQ